jgi:protease IV
MLNAFLKNVVKTTLQFFLAFFLFLFGLVFLILLISLAFSKPKTDIIKPNTVLVLDFKRPILEQTKAQIQFPSFKINKQLAFLPMLRMLERAKTDSNIQALVLNPDELQADWAITEELRSALAEFKQSGKPIYVYANHYENKSYYLSSVANKMFITPEGSIFWNGVGAHVSFYKNMLDKLGLSFVIARGRDNIYKSFVEPFMYTQMTAPNKEQLLSLTQNMWSNIKTQVAPDRALAVEDLQNIADKNPLLTAKQAYAKHLVDSVFYADEFETWTKAQFKDSIRLVDFENYYKKYRYELPEKGNIAVVYATGEIGYEENDETQIGKDFTKVLRQIRDDKDIQAVVFRVNSPGGSSLTSDLIYRELYLLNKVKPVVVSMGSLAASGGYYISAPATEIIASPFTITGSIGAFALLPTAEKLFEKIGITFDGVQTAEHANALKGFVVPQKVSPEEQKILQEHLSEVYEEFILKVALHRPVFENNAEKVHQVARGRVWGAIDAEKNGLVDKMGGIRYAIDRVAVLANITEPVAFEFTPKQEAHKELLAQILEEYDLQDEVKESFSSQVLFKQFNELIKFLRIKPLQTQFRMPYEITIQ